MADKTSTVFKEEEEKILLKTTDNILTEIEHWKNENFSISAQKISKKFVGWFSNKKFSLKLSLLSSLKIKFMTQKILFQKELFSAAKNKKRKSENRLKLLLLLFA